MSEPNWNAIISRLSAPAPIDLDEALFVSADAEQAATRNAPPDAPLATGRGPSTKLWDRSGTDDAYIGVTVNTLLPDPTMAALRLASAAMERGVTPIILTELPECGFERFGFRVERIFADTPEETEQLRAEISQFWNLAITIDISDVAMLG